MAQRKADRVLPDPVGATTTVWWPELIASHAPAWAVVGAVKLLRNHAAVAGENRSSTSARLPFAIGVSLPSPADSRPRGASHGSEGGQLSLARRHPTIRLVDAHVVDARLATAHVAEVVELPQLVAVRAPPLSVRVLRLVLEADRDAVAREGPQVLAQPV